jgi:diguanylate cyclase (GGDEF)-like protein/PAS domain S-box-containing protein
MIKRWLRSPIVRISLGLMLLTVSILLIGDLFFRMGDQSTRAVLVARKQLCESLAVQFSVLISNRETESMKDTLTMIVRRSDDVMSAALRASDGDILVEAGVHDRYWQQLANDKSTPTQAHVPIFNGSERWGTIEVRFSPLENSGLANTLKDPFFRLIAFVAFMGFIGYAMFMKQTLKHLDPVAVIPDRVKTALDVLAEGVVLVNEQAEIVLANNAFSRILNDADGALLGKNLSGMKWKDLDNKRRAKDLPWTYALETAKSALGVPLSLALTDGETRTFMVNGSPILDDKGAARGAMVTFDDITELEKKNEELNVMLDTLRESQEKIGQQNEKLQILATRDPLTSCLNRRAFNEECAREIESAKADGKPLSCIMMDIDHFKSVNDTYGHGVGDQVIKHVVNSARSGLRSIDIIGRYGGEEFCILLPGLDIGQAVVVAERLRLKIESEARNAIGTGMERIVTSSFGISSTEHSPFETAKLIDAADQALYCSKNSGRNRVSRVDEIDTTEFA